MDQLQNGAEATNKRGETLTLYLPDEEEEIN
jgi:hypothetical protein